MKEDPVRRGLLFAGTERGAFVSLDDGDSWQPLQLNLPVTSVRDFEIHENDLIVATHGRGFWVIDDISALRQFTREVLASDAHLFKPSDTPFYYPTGDNGTPLQKDEPQTDNAPSGVPIDYYVKNAAGPVTLEILDASGAVMQAFTSVPPAPQRRAGIPRVSPLWERTPPEFAAGPGMHRVVWMPVAPSQRGDFFRPPTPLTGAFTARLTVNGASQTQTFNVLPDPRPLPQ